MGIVRIKASAASFLESICSAVQYLLSMKVTLCTEQGLERGLRFYWHLRWLSSWQSKFKICSNKTHNNVFQKFQSIETSMIRMRTSKCTNMTSLLFSGVMMAKKSPKSSAGSMFLTSKRHGNTAGLEHKQGKAFHIKSAQMKMKTMTLYLNSIRGSIVYLT